MLNAIHASTIPQRLECNHVYERSVAWADYHDEWVEQRADEILGDNEFELNDLIVDYCDTSYISAITGFVQVGEMVKQ